MQLKKSWKNKMKQVLQYKENCVISERRDCLLRSSNNFEWPSPEIVTWKVLTFYISHFDLQNNIYKPYRKSNDKHSHINKSFNHPPSILKQLPKSIEKILSETSSTKGIFKRSLKPYQYALIVSGFRNDSSYIENNDNANDRKWKRKSSSIFLFSWE